MPPHDLSPLLIGEATLDGTAASGYRLTLPPTETGYANAQLDDYQQLPRRQFRWRPPLRLSVRARASTSDPQGTLGFGFWNDPLSFGQAGASRRVPALPRAMWFFHGSPPHDLELVRGVRGWGWKASSLNSMKAPALLPIAPLGLALTLVPLVRAPVIRAAQALINADECLLQHDLSRWHDYQLQWRQSRVEFSVDGSILLRTHVSPSGPLGFVTWIDNQYMAFSPASGIKFGVLATAEEQWLELSDLDIREL